MPVGPSLIDRAKLSPQENSRQTIPALIVVSLESSLKIATLAILDRLVVTAHRAGATPITIVSNGPLPSLKRSRALGIPFQTLSNLPAIDGPVLFATANLLVQTADVKRCIESGSRLLSTAGEPLSLGVIDQTNSSPDSALAQLPSIEAVGVAQRVTDQASASALERALWSSLTSSADGVVDRVFNRPCGRPLSKLLIHTPITPNFISVISTIVGIISAIFFALGTYQSTIIGALLLQFSAVIDCVDGDVARVVFKETPIGKWIDFVGDQIVHVTVFAGIALGVAKSAGAPQLLWLGVSAVLGALLSCAVVLRGMRSSTAQNSGLKRLIDASANRDFSVLVLLLALFNLTTVFLWLAAIGSHLFWTVALALQFAQSGHQSVAET